jgi:hypothetical protein
MAKTNEELKREGQVTEVTAERTSADVGMKSGGEEHNYGAVPGTDND